MFVAFEGIDGAGKSTVSQRLGELLVSANIETRYINKKNVSAPNEYLQSHVDRIRTLIWGYPHSAPIEKLGDSHWLHLMSSWFYLVDELTIRPTLSKGGVVIIEGWTAKFIARFALKSKKRLKQASESMSELVEPDLTFYLRTKPSKAAERKGKFTPSECGALDSSVPVDSTSFVEYQTRITGILDEFACTNDWNKIDTMDKSVESLAQSCFDRVMVGLRSGAS